MADVEKLFGYDIADATARTAVASMGTDVSAILTNTNEILSILKSPEPPNGWLNNGKTNIWIELLDSNNLVYPVKPASGATIDWGDGSVVETSTGTIMNHTYSAVGSYVISISGLTEITTNLLGGTWDKTKNVSTINIPKYNLTTVVKYVEIPSTVTSIGNYAFNSCYNLVSIKIPSSVTSIGNQAFSGCYNLTSIKIPSSVTSIGNQAFSSCMFLASIEILSGITNIDMSTFSNCYNLQSVTIPSTVTRIGKTAFSSCYKLVSIEIPSGVTSIDMSAFSYCYNLQSVTIPSTVTSIGNQAFSGCYNLTSIKIPSGVTSIGSQVFYNCYNLQSITIPSTVTSIGNYAFTNCGSLASITALATAPPTISSGTLPSVSYVQHIYVPAEAVDTYKSAQYWSDYASVIEAIPSE